MSRVTRHDPRTPGYLFEALRPEGKWRGCRSNIAFGDRITLGQLPAPVPSAGSAGATARLIVSGHRLPLAVERVLLMAETLVLGSDSQSHICIPELKQPVVLYRHHDSLAVRCAGSFAIDGQAQRERGVLGPHSRVSGDEFAFALEPVGRQLGRM